MHLSQSLWHTADVIYSGVPDMAHYPPASGLARCCRSDVMVKGQVTVMPSLTFEWVESGQQQCKECLLNQPCRWGCWLLVWVWSQMLRTTPSAGSHHTHLSRSWRDILSVGVRRWSAQLHPSPIIPFSCPHLCPHHKSWLTFKSFSGVDQ